MKPTVQQELAITLRGPKRDLLVSAAAGSGKTSVLVKRLLNACENGAHIDDFLVITYTRAAAGELRGRIQKEMSALRRENPADKRWGVELLRLHRANIGTIHAFCAGVLRDNAVEAGVRPDFRQLEGEEENELKLKALDLALERLYSNATDGFNAFADSLSDLGGDRRLGAVILRLYNSLQAHPHPDIWMDEQLEILENGGDPWRDYLVRASRRTLDFAERLLRKTQREMRDYPDIDAVYGQAFHSDLEIIEILKNDISASFAFEKLGRAKKTPESQYFQEIRNYCKKLLSFEVRGISNEERKAALETARGVFSALRIFAEEYTTLKARRNVLDFSDLEHITHAFLRTNHDVKFEEVLVDEYQDVNQVQEDIIHFLKSPVFMVGDVRQSVYGFRQADPGIFLKKYNSWQTDGGAGTRIILPHNFRSENMLLNAVNTVFEKIMLGMEYGENELLRPAPDADCKSRAPLATLVYCDRAELNDDSQMWKRVELEAKMCADICDGEISKNGKKPSDIAILLRTKSDMAVFKRALGERGIPSEGQEDNIYASLEIQVALAYLQILDNPRQDMPLIAVMRSPLYGFSPDELAAVRAAADGDFCDAVFAAAEKGDSKCGTLCNDLAFLREAGGDGGADATYHAMLERLGLLELFGAMPDGEWRRDNLLGIIPIAAASATVSDLCGKLVRLRDGGQSAESVSAKSGVALMTMHKSKGLEFDTVIVADLAREFNRTDAREPVLFHKELGLGLKFTDVKRRFQYPTPAREAVAQRLNEDMLCEETRLLYVALTRAKKRLYVTLTIPDIEKRLEKLCMGLDGKPDEFQLLNAKNMADWLLLALAEDGELSDTDAWTVERWSADTSTVLRKTEPAAAEDNTETVQYGGTQKARLTYKYADSVALPSKLTVTELNPREDRDTTFAKPRFMEKHKRLDAAARGTALHAAIQLSDLTVCTTPERAKAEIARLERELRLTPEQAEAVAPSDVSGFVNSPVGRRALASEDMRREFAFSLLTPAHELLTDSAADDLVLFQGVIDLLFREKDGWVIVDFKTTFLGRRKPEKVAAEYKTQLEAYARAVERLTGKRVCEKIVFFLDGSVAVVI